MSIIHPLLTVLYVHKRRRLSQEKLGTAETVIGEEGVYTGDPPRIPSHNINKIQNRLVLKISSDIIVQLDLDK
jgi:hypothetical protein